jgi:hypothetical protein
MNRSLVHMNKYTIWSAGEVIGRADRFFVGLERWAIRYIVARTLESPPRFLLFSPLALSGVDWPGRSFQTCTSTRELEWVPEVTSEGLFSRSEEAEYHRRLRLPQYWGGVGIWGDHQLPYLLAVSPHPSSQNAAAAAPSRLAKQEAHLISSEQLFLAGVRSQEGLSGRIADLLMDEDTWAVRFLVVDTGRRLPMRKLIVDPSWIERHDRGRNMFYVGLPQAAIREATEIHEEARPWKY